MRVLWLFAILISSALFADELKHVRSANISLLSIELLSSVDDVKAVFGVPEKVISNKYDVYDEIYSYEGLDIGFMDGKVDYIKITSPKWKLANGLFVGKVVEIDEVGTFTINESDCYLNVLASELTITEIRIFCAI